MVKNEEYAATRQEERFLQRLNGPVGVSNGMKRPRSAKYGRKRPHNGQERVENCHHSGQEEGREAMAMAEKPRLNA